MTKQTGTVAILGCGWVGLELGRSLRAQGFQVLGSTTRSSRSQELRAIGLEPFVIDLATPDGTRGNEVFWSAPRLVITIPPQTQTQGEDALAQLMIRALEAWHPNEVEGKPKVVFTSSVSVYGSFQGEVTESDEPIPSEPGGRACRRAELALSKSQHPWATVRLGGLFGPGRNPARYLAGRMDLADGGAPVNLIHRDDVIGVIERILETEGRAAEGAFNLVIPDAISKQEFYQAAARDLRLPPPTFSPLTSAKPNWKRVRSSRIETDLAYDFRVRDYESLRMRMCP